MTLDISLDERCQHLTILKHFPDTQAAEHEVLVRVQAAAIELGLKVSILEVDSELTSAEICIIEAKQGVVLDLHFQYPKFLKGNSIGVLWTPVPLMTEWSLPNVWANQISHDVICITGETETARLARLYRPSDQSFPVLNHTLPGSWLVPPRPHSTDRTIRAFYAGIGWDKINNRPGRHQEIFERLDSLDILDIYGPKEIHGLKPWAGFRSYRGAVPFDGRSILEAANNSGAMLVWSSKHHVETEIMSNRLFEALAARCVVIGDEHPFIREVLGDSAFYVDMTKSARHISGQVLDVVAFLNANPDVVKSCTETGTEVFLREFDLTKQLKEILTSQSQSQSQKNTIEDMAAIVFSDKRNIDLQHQLSRFGITETIEVLNVPNTIEDVIRIASRSTTKDVIFLTGDVELMDNFPERITALNKRMIDRNVGIGCLTGIVTFASAQFAPTIIEKCGNSAIPLQGLVIRKDSRPLMIETTPIDPVVSLRVPRWESVLYVHLSIGPLEILDRAIASNAFSEPSTMGVRNVVQFEMNKLSQNSSQQNSIQTVVDSLISSGETSRRKVLFSLLSTIPGLKPFRKFLRPIANYFIRHSQ